MGLRARTPKEAARPPGVETTQTSDATKLGTLNMCDCTSRSRRQVATRFGASIWEEAMISEEFNKKTLAATDLALERAMSAPQ